MTNDESHESFTDQLNEMKARIFDIEASLRRTDHTVARWDQENVTEHTSIRAAITRQNDDLAKRLDDAQFLSKECVEATSLLTDMVAKHTREQNVKGFLPAWLAVALLLVNLAYVVLTGSPPPMAAFPY